MDAQIKFHWYTLAELKLALHNGDYLVEKVAGRLYRVVITQHGALMKAVGFGVALNAPILMKWTDLTTLFALVQISPIELGAPQT